MSTRRIETLATFALTFLVFTGGQASAASIVLNGSLEAGSFVNTGCNYMTLGAGSTAIADWTVAPSTTGDIVWADSPTCDGFTAPDGDFFVDLSGLGQNSPNGSLQQQLDTIIGQSYSVSLDLATLNDAAVSVMVGPDLLALSAGVPFVVGTTSWTPYTAAFVASLSDPLLTITKSSPGSIVFVDNVSIVEEGPAPVPEPASMALLAVGLACLGACRWRRP